MAKNDKQWSSATPGLLIILLDQSGSMMGDYEGTTRTKFASLAVNKVIDNIILTLMPGKNMETIKIGNGRETIWENLLNYADQKPWLGWGFACIERVQQLGIIGGQSLSDAHSNYIGMYGSLGIVGCSLFGWHLLSIGHYLFKRISQPGFLGLLAAFICATVNGYSYGFLSGKTCSITVGYIMIVILSFYYDYIPLDDNDEDDAPGA